MMGVWLWEPPQRTAALPAWLDYGVYARNAAHVMHKVAHFRSRGGNVPVPDHFSGEGLGSGHTVVLL